MVWWMLTTKIRCLKYMVCCGTDHFKLETIVLFNWNIPLYRKADWPSFNNHMLEFHVRSIGGGAPTLEVNQLWVEFKQAIHNGISKYIPHKLAMCTNRKPWVSRETYCDKGIERIPSKSLDYRNIVIDTNT